MFAAEYDFDDQWRDDSHYRVDIGITCGKRIYTSVRAARLAHAKAHYRVRAFWCDECGGYHVTNNEKR